MELEEDWSDCPQMSDEEIAERERQAKIVYDQRKVEHRQYLVENISKSWVDKFLNVDFLPRQSPIFEYSFDDVSEKVQTCYYDHIIDRHVTPLRCFFNEKSVFFNHFDPLDICTKTVVLPDFSTYATESKFYLYKIFDKNIGYCYVDKCPRAIRSNLVKAVVKRKGYSFDVSSVYPALASEDSFWHLGHHNNFDEPNFKPPFDYKIPLIDHYQVHRHYQKNRQ